MKSILAKKILFALFITFFLSSCDDCVFTSRNATTVMVRFYVKGKNVKIPVRIYFDSLKTSKNGLLLKDSTKEASIALPLHPYENISKFYILRNVRVGNQIIKQKDSIEFSYQRNFLVVSPRCGYDQRIDDIRLSKISFDSTEIFKSNLEINDTVNVRIFLKQ